MAKITPFEQYTDHYEDWFEKNEYVYRSELSAIKKVIPERGKGIEIGVGTGRFASPLGITCGIDPSGKMRAVAEQRGIKVREGVAENIPYNNSQFDFALIVTTLCFFDEIEAAFKEVHRIVKPGGSFIIGFVDKNSPIGQMYQEKKNKSVFYKEATFYSVEEVVSCLEGTGFTPLSFHQTLFKPLQSISETEQVKQGYGEGSFVVIHSRR